jgi:D,D-heptose 1,7-bisphosphate phosphatase
MQAVVLAGGKGTRLGELAREIPKPMMMIGDKPLLHHQVNLLARYGINDIIFLVNHLREPILDYFGNGSRFGVSIRYFEETVPLGTTGGIKEIESWLKGDFLVLYGDVMVHMDLHRLMAFHAEKKSDCTLVLHPNDHPYDSDLVETDITGHIKAFHPKPHDPAAFYHNLVNAGVYILSKSVLDFIDKGVKADFGHDLFPKLTDRISMFGYRTTEYLKDMGTPDRLEKVKKDLESGRVEAAGYEHKQKAIFLDRDGVLNVERNYLSNPDDLELFSYVPDAVKKINKSGLLSVVVTNQSAVARNLCTEEDVQAVHKKMEHLLGLKGAWLDGIYYCPHHPDKGFPEENPRYKIDCECRKPKTGMFRDAARDFNIDLQQSYMIGDSERDIQAGKNAGCTTIGVRTGYGIRKTKVWPDYMFNNLAEAVDFITGDPFRGVFETILAKYNESVHNRPYLILLGGNARTGKSTLASYLRLSFLKKGVNALDVQLDNWLLPEESRKPGMNVFDRFRLPDIVADIRRLLDGNSLELNRYVNHPERKSQPVILDPHGMQVILVDGVVALSSPELRSLANLRLYTSVPPEILKKRIDEYYTWRGKTTEEIETMVEKRKSDEYQLIEKESNLADMIINACVS